MLGKPEKKTFRGRNRVGSVVKRGRSERQKHMVTLLKERGGGGGEGEVKERGPVQNLRKKRRGELLQTWSLERKEEKESKGVTGCESTLTARGGLLYWCKITNGGGGRELGACLMSGDILTKGR